MRTSDKMLFALLRASLHERATETAFFAEASVADWNECYLTANRQGVMALAWDGVMRLPARLQPDLDLKLQWGINVETQEKVYLRYCKAICEISSFFKEHGIATMMLKGVGLSTLYPVPAHREGGDLDIYTYSDCEAMTDKEANTLADKLMAQRGMDVNVDKTPKHSNFYYQGIPVENHKVFTNLHAYRVAHRVEAILKECMEPQKASLPSGDILVPSPRFNTLFVFFHAAQHFGSGLSLHHLCDWAMIIKNYGLHLPEELQDERLLKAAGALTDLCNRYLGTAAPANGNRGFADFMLQEMLYPKYYKRTVPRSKGRLLVYKLKRFVYNHRIKHAVFNHSPWKGLYASIKFHLLHPGKIFR